MKVTLETDRLILNPFEMSDAISMYNNWASDSEVTKYVTWNTHENVEVTKNILNTWTLQYEKPERINFAIRLKETLELIGGIDVVGYIDGIPVIGYVLGRKFWNYGYMTEACKKVLDFLFSLGYEKVRIDALVENIASNKVIIKCGGEFVHTYKDYLKQKDKDVLIKMYYINKK